ncbi:MAG: hypothetical protein J5911_05540 [Clostridia bacterium]|nr:hypothetical protein [Clostridia bacterium]
MSLLLCNITADWSQFWPGMIATFVGFVLGIFSDRLLIKISESNERKIAKESLLAEIKKIKEEIDSTKSDNEVHFEIQPLKTPVWDSLISTNKIALFSNKKYSKELEHYFDFYALVNEYNKWYELLSQSYFYSTDYKKDNEKLKSIRRSLKQTMENLKNAGNGDTKQ